MPNIDIAFPDPINASIQIGDTVYFVNTNNVGSFDINSSSVVMLGTVVNLIGNVGFYLTMTVSTSLPASDYPVLTDYFFFTKDNKANQSSVLGYYSEVQFRNDSTDEAEIFSIGVDSFQSSK